MLPAEIADIVDDAPGVVSVWLGGVDGSVTFTRNEHAEHYAASTMKVAVMAAAYRLAETGHLDLDDELAVHDDFASAAPGVERFRNDRGYDNDPQPWERVGGTASLRWLIRRMIIMSSNLSTNLVMERLCSVDATAIAEVWSVAGAKHSKTERGIEDYAAREAELTNIVTAADLSALLVAIHCGRLAGPAATAEMLEVLRAQEANEALMNGLPAGTVVASKSGWVDEVRHSMAIITPAHGPAFVLTTCVSAPLDETGLNDITTKLTAATWAARPR